MAFLSFYLENEHTEQHTDRLKPEFLAHAGMAETAVNIYRQLLAKHILQRALSQCPDADVVVTGHSLGAGTATILGFLLRERYPNTYV